MQGRWQSGIAQDFVATGVHQDGVGVRVPLPQPVLNGRHGQAQPGFAAAQRFYHGVLLGHIVDVAVPQGAAIGLTLGVGSARQPADFAIRSYLAPFKGPGLQRVCRLPDAGRQSIHVLRMHTGKGLVCIGLRRLWRDAVDVHDARTGIRKARAAVCAQPELVNHAWHLCQQFGQARLHLGTCGFRLMPLGDIQVGACDVGRRLRRIWVHQLSAQVHPNPLAVLVPQPGFGFKVIRLSPDMGLQRITPFDPVAGVHEGLQLLLIQLLGLRWQSEQGGPAHIKVHLVCAQGPVPGAQLAALQRQAVALLVALQLHVVLLLPCKQNGNPGGSQKQGPCAQRIAPAAFAHGNACSRQSLVASQPYADDEGVVGQALPGIQPLYAIDGCGALVQPAVALGVAQKLALRRHVLVQHFALQMGARQIGPVGANQQCHVFALSEHFTKVA